jgi:hypothetical protein
VRKRRCVVHARRKGSLPLVRVAGACAPQCMSRPASAAGADQARGQQPRRLHGHADAFANDRMGLGRGIADHQLSIRAAPRRPNAGSYRPTPKPRTFTPRALEDVPQGASVSTQIAFEGFARGPHRGNGPAGLEDVATNASRKYQLAILRDDETTVATLEGNDGQDSRRQALASESCLESEKVASSPDDRPRAPGIAFP